MANKQSKWLFIVGYKLSENLNLLELDVNLN